MRLHRLEVTAFGPFADSVEVDFDDLSSHGLFLLHGATGAGKTSLLDAVCYALYGQVPGLRAVTALRSHLADAETEPVVALEFSVGARRFHVRRSPAWERPKRRGAGTTTAQASVKVREHVGGEWRARATRLDEVGLLLTDVLGMNMDQFTKVVLLPQGDFAAFLHSPADQRRNLLQKLFGTGRFEAVERILADRRRDLARQCDIAHAERETLRARVAERATSVCHLIGAPEPNAGEDASSDIELPALLSRIERALGPARETATRSSAELEAARQAQTRVEASLNAFQAWTAATVARDVLAADQTRIDDVVQQLDAAQRAGTVAGPLEVLTRDERELADAQRDQAAALEAIVPLLAAQTLPGLGLDITPREADLTTAAGDRRGELGHLERLLRVEQSLETWQHEEREHASALAGVTDRRATLLGKLASLAARQTELQKTLAGAAKSAANLQSAEREVQQARRMATAAEELDVVSRQLTEADDDRRIAVDLAQSARATALDLTRRRLEGIAAELAAGLLEGGHCPVCGSVDHPTPAAPSEHSVSPDAEDSARTAADLADSAVQVTVDRVSSLRERVSALTEAAQDNSAESARSLIQTSQAALDIARRAVELETTTTTELQSIAAALPTHGANRDALDADITSRTRRLAEIATRIADAQATLANAIGSDDSVWAKHERLTREAKLLESARDSVARLGRAQAAVKRARTSAVKACNAAGFPDIASLRTAIVTEEASRALQLEVQTHRDCVLENQTRLAELTQRDGLSHQEWQSETLTIEDLHQAAEAAKTAVAESVQSRERAVAAVDWLDKTRTAAKDLAQRSQQWEKRFAPLQSRYEVVREISQCAEGSGSNTLKMRLSAFALATRLDQVAAAASIRLSRMSSDRYTLVHTESARRASGRAGLSIAVLDAWTGRERDPGSLSGGETFLASLALALGLADVVQAEAGGSAIETLFVDEGFGSLDDESLDLVMDTLDGLREGGRAVGVVSHVPELRMRIPAQIEVLRQASGSTIRTR